MTVPVTPEVGGPPEGAEARDRWVLKNPHSVQVGWIRGDSVYLVPGLAVGAANAVARGAAPPDRPDAGPAAGRAAVASRREQGPAHGKEDFSTGPGTGCCTWP